MYKYFRTLGAKPFRNAYGELPWTQESSKWILPRTDYNRNPEEFYQTYEAIEAFERDFYEYGSD
jgi:hypothetical protein